MRRWFRSASRWVTICAIVATRVPSFFRQAIHLRQAQRSWADGDILVVAIASNRLPLSADLAGARMNLGLLGRCGGAVTDQTIATKITDADYVLLFESASLQQLLETPSRVLARERLRRRWIIPDLLPRSFRAAGFAEMGARGWRDGRRRIAAPLQVPRGKARRRAVASALIERCYVAVLRPPARVEGVFFTFNSRLTELLRAYLITRSDCRTIHEVMHGRR